MTIIAPNLEVGADHVRNMLDVDIPFGGRHAEMGTHNRLARLGNDVFLEIIAVDQAAKHPGRARWFGLDDADAVRRAWDAGHRLRGWVVRTSDIDSDLSAHGTILGLKAHVSRGDRSWSISVPPDGSLPAQGVAPSVIDWGSRGTPAMAMINLGLTLEKFWIEHPDLTMVQNLYENLGVQNAPQVQKAARFRYKASISTPSGLRELY